MKKINAVVKKEWLSFFGSERGLLIVYAVLIVGWSFLPLAGTSQQQGMFGWLLFAVIISSNFAGPVFVAERMSGAMEVLLTSGLSRSTVLWGKLLFVAMISSIAGACSFVLSLLWQNCAGMPQSIHAANTLQNTLLFCAGVAMNTASTAWLSVRLRSPRTVPLTGMLFTALPVAVWYVFADTCSLPQWLLAAAVALFAALFIALAQKEFNGERIIQPIHT
jgi:ABC-type Na+ efflux pump permease subunit